MDRGRVVLALSKLSRKNSHDIQPHLSLASLGLTSSFGLSALRSLFESESGKKLPPLSVNMTVEQVIELITGGAAEVAVSSPQSAAPLPVTVRGDHGVPARDAAQPSLAGIGLGMDMQEIGSLPAVSDYRTDAFYAAHFTQAEIATALLRPDPRAHLCGVFCAKEAAKKSHPALLDLRMTELIVLHDQAGRPAIRLKDDRAHGMRFEFVVSITHTERYAAATCLTFGGAG
jgi:holo-[acyl-carrier protein] synthase